MRIGGVRQSLRIRFRRMRMSMFGTEGAVSFANRLATSDSFKSLFREGMTLVEETAAYLDGEGREEARALSRLAALAYATESMRLTTRLMQIASWLLLQRAVNEGELSQAEAAGEKRRIHLSEQTALSAKHALAALPPRLRELVAASLRLQARIIHFDLLIYKSCETRSREASPPSPVKRQIEQLHAAFARKRVPFSVV